MQGLGGGVQLGHVLGGARQAQRLAIGVGDQLGPAVKAADAAVGPDDPVLEVDRRAGLDRLFHLRLDQLAVIGVDVALLLGS